MVGNATERVPVVSEVTAAVEHASLALVEMTLSALASSPRMSTLQLRLLLVVDRHSPLNLSALATRLDLSVPSASRLVDRLVEAKLVQRGVAKHSRREVALSLTPSGRRALSYLRRSRQQAIRRVLEVMSASDRQALLVGLRAFADAEQDLDARTDGM
jgi:DNA-binding MarR family transcriptional regulator